MAGLDGETTQKGRGACTYVGKPKVATGTPGCDSGRGVKIGWGVWKDYLPSSVFTLSLSFFFLKRWGFRSLLTPEQLITIHMSHTPHIIRVRKQN